MSEIPTLRVSVKLESPHDPNKYFRSGSRLRITRGFRERVLAKAGRSEEGLEIRASAPPPLSGAKEVVSDAYLLKGLPERYFDETRVCALVAALLDSRPQFLPERGERRLFFTETSFVSLYRSEVEGFVLDAGRRGGGQWVGRVRVFVPD